MPDYDLTFLDSALCFNICYFCSRSSNPISCFGSTLVDFMMRETDFGSVDNYVIVNFHKIYSCPDCYFVPYSEVRYDE